MNEILAGSDSTLLYTPQSSTGAFFDAAPTLDSFSLSDEDGASVTLAASATWSTPDHGWTLDVASGEVPVPSGSTVFWTECWTWTSAGTTTRHEAPVRILRYLTNDLCSLEAVRAHLGLKGSDTDTRLLEIIAAESENIRALWQIPSVPKVTEARTLKPVGLVVFPDEPLYSVTAVVGIDAYNAETTLVADSSYVVRAGKRSADPLRWIDLTADYDFARVTGTWGADVLPADIVRAAVLRSAIAYKRSTGSSSPDYSIAHEEREAERLLAPYRAVV